MGMSAPGPRRGSPPGLLSVFLGSPCAVNKNAAARPGSIGVARRSPATCAHSDPPVPTSFGMPTGQDVDRAIQLLRGSYAKTVSRSRAAQPLAVLWVKGPVRNAHPARLYCHPGSLEGRDFFPLWVHSAVGSSPGTGRSAAWLARSVWDAEVGGSNPPAPTSKSRIPGRRGRASATFTCGIHP